VHKKTHREQDSKAEQAWTRSCTSARKAARHAASATGYESGTAHKMDINLFDTNQRRFGDVQLVLY
jgi:hypothetical protein